MSEATAGSDAPRAAAGAEVKRRYWKLSLLVHPDKCADARAKEAFQAVSAARSTLMSADRRARLDARIDASERAAQERALAAQRVREAEWRRRAGTARAGDEALLGARGAAGPAAREEWMTMAPPPAQPAKTMRAPAR